ncbi:MAG: thiamine pyrophosphate-binding protein [Burkholderiaceae bacterium]
MNKKTGGRILVESLAINGVNTVFGVPGESYLEALDAIHDQPGMRYITCRQEGGAAFMAEAHAKLTSRPGVCFVTRGPGASNASIGVHAAFQNSTPLILLVGQVPRRNIEREAFQEIDYRRMFGQTTKWVAQVDDAARIPEFVNRAFQTAMSGRPGPVVLALPEDVLRELTDAALLARANVVQAHPGAADIATLRCMLEAAERPLFLLGGSVWTDAARLAFEEFAKRHQIPVAVAFRRQDLFDNRHACYAGDLAWGNIASLVAAVEQSDLIVSLGARLDEGTTSKYTLLKPPKLKQPFVHILPGAEELGRVFQADLMVNAGVCETALALHAMAPLLVQPTWAGWCARLHQGYLQSFEVGPQPGALDMGRVMAYLRRKLPHDAIVTTGAGNFADWPNKIYQYGGIGTCLSPVSGAMGYGVPAAVAASITHPGRTVVCFSGDGDFLMNGQEIATATQYGAKPIILVVNNNMYGTIRMHQQMRHPGRVSATELVNPDFAMFGRAFGGHGECVKRTEDFVPAFERALASGKLALIELQIDPECICFNMPRLSDLGKP